MQSSLHSNTKNVKNTYIRNPTPLASLPLDVEIMQQEEQKQQEVHVDEVLELNIASKREELIEPQRDVSKSSYGPLEMSEFKKYLTGDNDTEQYQGV